MQDASEPTSKPNTADNVEGAGEPKSLSQQLFEAAQSHRTRARELRLNNPGNSLEADALDAHAGKLEDKTLEIATQSEIKRESIRFEKWLKEQEHYNAWHLENARSVISMSQSAVRVIATANAGAAVALLAFLGNALAKDAHDVAEHFAYPLLTFAIGVVIAVLVAGASYLTQLFYGDSAPKKQKLAIRLHWLSAILWFATTGAFAVGCVETYFAVRSMAKNEGTSMRALDRGSGSVDVQMPGPKPPAEPVTTPKQ